MKQKIPNNLAGKSKWALRRYVKAMQRAIKAECLRCMGAETLRGVKDCEGLHLQEGNCPLYDYRPFRGNK